MLKRPTLKNEVKQLKKVFREIDGYPNWVIEQTTKSKERKGNGTNILGNN